MLRHISCSEHYAALSPCSFNNIIGPWGTCNMDNNNNFLVIFVLSNVFRSWRLTVVSVQELLPINKRTIEHFTTAFEGPELQPIVEFQVYSVAITLTLQYLIYWLSLPRWLVKPVKCPSVRQCGVDIFKSLKLQDCCTEVDETWLIYSMGCGSKLIGSGILNFGPCAAWGHHKLSPVGREDPLHMWCIFIRLLPIQMTIVRLLNYEF